MRRVQLPIDRHANPGPVADLLRQRIDHVARNHLIPGARHVPGALVARQISRKPQPASANLFQNLSNILRAPANEHPITEPIKHLDGLPPQLDAIDMKIGPRALAGRGLENLSEHVGVLEILPHNEKTTPIQRLQPHRIALLGTAGLRPRTMDLGDLPGDRHRITRHSPAAVPEHDLTTPAQTIYDLGDRLIVGGVRSG